MSDTSRPAGGLVKLTKAATPIATGPTRGLLCGTPGTFTGVDASGRPVTDLPLQQGYNPIQVSIWSAGTADDVWALY